MKNKLKIAIVALVGAVLSGCVVLDVHGQTNSPNPELNFFQTAMSWASSLNTNADHSWTGTSLAFDTGVATTTGVGIADRLNVSKPFGSFAVGVSGEFVGVGSTFNLLEGTASYDLVNKYDFRMAVQVGAGYNWNATDSKGKTVGAMVVEPGLAIYKKMTLNTYSTVGISFPVLTKGKFEQQPKVYIGVGFTF